MGSGEESGEKALLFARRALLLFFSTFSCSFRADSRFSRRSFLVLFSFFFSRNATSPFAFVIAFVLADIDTICSTFDSRFRRRRRY